MIILFFLCFFFYNNYNDIKRYFDGNKYDSINRVSENTFVLELVYKGNHILIDTTYVFLNKKVREYFKNYEVVTRYSEVDRSLYYSYSVTSYNDSDFEKIDRKVKEFNNLIIEMHKNKISEIFSLSSHGLYGNFEKSNFLETSNLSVHDLYIFKLHRQSIHESLKLGQTKKILLSKLILGNLLISMFLAVSICVIIRIIRNDIYQSKNNLL